jgi:hypothetical protein
MTDCGAYGVFWYLPPAPGVMTGLLTRNVFNAGNAASDIECKAGNSLNITGNRNNRGTGIAATCSVCANCPFGPN